MNEKLPSKTTSARPTKLVQNFLQNKLNQLTLSLSLCFSFFSNELF